MISKKKIFKNVLCATISASTFFATCGNAAQVLETSIIKCGVAGTSSGCGDNPPATDPLKQGSVQINDDGDVIVNLKGARPNTKYTMFIGNWVTRGRWQVQLSGAEPCGGVGSITTNNSGDFIGQVQTSTGTFTLPKDVFIGQINFAFNNPACLPTQFASGVVIR